MLKKLWLMLPVCIACITMHAFAQTAGVKPPGDIPPFRMLQGNGAMFSASDLQPNKPVIIIYFQPNCEHCQALMNDLFKKIVEFNGTQLVMVTYVRPNEMAAFQQSYHTDKYPNIKVGTEGNAFFLRQYYHIMNTPFTALYDRHGKLVCSYANQTPVDALVAQVKKLRT